MNATVKALNQTAPVETVIRTPSLDEAGVSFLPNVPTSGKTNSLAVQGRCEISSIHKGFLRFSLVPTQMT
jgi:hypothetical protein